MAGVAVGVLGIALCGSPGDSRNAICRNGTAGPGEFSLIKGLLLSLLAGVLSAVYGIGLNDVAKPIIASRRRSRRRILEDQCRFPVCQSRRLSDGARLLPLSCPKEPIARRVDPAPPRPRTRQASR